MRNACERLTAPVGDDRIPVTLDAGNINAGSAYVWLLLAEVRALGRDSAPLPRRRRLATLSARMSTWSTIGLILAATARSPKTSSQKQRGRLLVRTSEDWS